MNSMRLAMGLALLLGASTARGVTKLTASVQMGLRVTPTNEQLRKALGVEGEDGAFVLEVETDGPAAKGGLRAGDVLTRVAGKPVGHAAAVLEVLAERKPGDEVQVEYVRDRQAKLATVTLTAARPRRQQLGRWSFELPNVPPDVERHMRGFQDRVERQLRELDQRLRRLEKDTDEPEPS